MKGFVVRHVKREEELFRELSEGEMPEGQMSGGEYVQGKCPRIPYIDALLIENPTSPVNSATTIYR